MARLTAGRDFVTSMRAKAGDRSKTATRSCLPDLPRTFEWFRGRLFRPKRFCAAETYPTKWMRRNGTALGGVLNHYAY